MERSRASICDERASLSRSSCASSGNTTYPIRRTFISRCWKSTARSASFPANKESRIGNLELPIRLCNVRSLGLHIHGIDRLARRHKQPVPLRSAEAEVGANLRQQDLADPLTVRREDVHAVIAFPDPSAARP